MATTSSALVSSAVLDTTSLLDRLSENPDAAKLLSDFRRQAFALLDRTVTELVCELGEEDRLNTKAKLLNSTTTQLLATASRQTARTVKDRREFARTILVSGLYNQHNPDWDMTDADSYRTETDDLLLLLMQRPDPLHG